MDKCADCGSDVDPLDMFPGQRCLACYKDAPETRVMVRGMTAQTLTRMWGGR